MKKELKNKQSQLRYTCQTNELDHEIMIKNYEAQF
jgi:hypothetical protein